MFTTLQTDSFNRGARDRAQIWDMDHNYLNIFSSSKFNFCGGRWMGARNESVITNCNYKFFKSGY